MAVLCLKARPGFPGLVLDGSRHAREAFVSAPKSILPLLAADVVLYDTAINQYTLITRNPSTGVVETTLLPGSRRGLALCREMGHYEELGVE